MTAFEKKQRGIDTPSKLPDTSPSAAAVHAPTSVRDDVQTELVLGEVTTLASDDSEELAAAVPAALDEIDTPPKLLDMSLSLAATYAPTSVPDDMQAEPVLGEVPLFAKDHSEELAAVVPNDLEKTTSGDLTGGGDYKSPTQALMYILFASRYPTSP